MLVCYSALNLWLEVSLKIFRFISGNDVNFTQCLFILFLFGQLYSKCDFRLAVLFSMSTLLIVIILYNVVTCIYFFLNKIDDDDMIITQDYRLA